jgi:hypothetical protein
MRNINTISFMYVLHEYVNNFDLLKKRLCCLIWMKYFRSTWETFLEIQALRGTRWFSVVFFWELNVDFKTLETATKMTSA